MKQISRSEITPESTFRQRRRFLKQFGLLTAGATLAACGVVPETTPQVAQTQSDEISKSDWTPYEEATSYTNYYEFSLSKNGVAEAAKDFKTSPWVIQIEGLVKYPGNFNIDDLISSYGEEERIYRHRCVEAWSMVIPWLGFPLSKLLTDLQPTPEAKFVQFETLFDPDQMPQLKSSRFPFPYVEGLRLDEAMHDLTILATGMYGKSLLPQNGAPLRLVVPWKYGFKGIKSITKIKLVDYQPATFWEQISPDEYGFYANVNPNIDHPRWTQRKEYRIGKEDKVDTLMFNGYEEEVAALYEGMDLKTNF